ncbi:MAG: exo-alpha-sialidase [Opitutaceae bacterium]|nr:exo-alpha-sialidase [Opitutaceae bacterium]
MKTPGGDYLVMFAEGDHYANNKGVRKNNGMMACRSTDGGRTWTKPQEAFAIDYSQHGFIPFVPRGSKRIYAFGTQPDPDQGYDWKDGKQENAPIGFRWSDDDGRTWSATSLIRPENDPNFMGMSVMRMTETDAGTWLIGSHTADWSVRPFTTRQYLLRSSDRGTSWQVLPGQRPSGWQVEKFHRMDEARPINLGGGRVLMMSRTPAGSLFLSRSADDGRTWTDFEPSPLVHPGAPPMLFHLGDGRTLIAFHHNRVPRGQDEKLPEGSIDPQAENMKVRSELWFSTSRDEGRTWSEPRFIFANAAAPEVRVKAWNYQCSYLDLFMDGDELHLFLPHRWQQVLHLTVKESELSGLPSKANLQVLARSVSR